jgi:hypothetical protein
MGGIQIHPIETRVREPFQTLDIVADVKDGSVPPIETSYNPLGTFECVLRSQPSELGVRSPVGVVLAIEKPPRIDQMKLFGLDRTQDMSCEFALEDPYLCSHRVLRQDSQDILSSWAP